MKSFTQTFIKYSIWALIFSGATYAYAVGTWSEPACDDPTQCNTEAPINAGSESQTKEGFLWVQGLGSNAGGYFATTLGVGVSSSTDPVSLGLVGVFGGKIGATEFCDETGNDCLSMAQINEFSNTTAVDESLSCPTNPTISTMANREGVRLTVPYATHAASIAAESAYDDQTYDGTTFVFNKQYSFLGSGWSSGWGTANVTIPDACKSDDGCVIKQIIYRKRELTSTKWSEKIERVRYSDYREDATSGYWTTTDYPKGGTNGNTTSSNMLKTYSFYNTANGGTYQVILRDDRSGYETTKGVVRPYDNWASAGQELYFCTYGTDTAI
jgi:hypothetical protein